MNLCYLTTDDWRQFETEQPHAFLWLMQASVRSEYAFLLARPCLTVWQKARLAELTALYGTKEDTTTTTTP